ncbi:MAG: DedA family protein [Candidatus Paceibacterota bacterium]
MIFEIVSYLEEVVRSFGVWGVLLASFSEEVIAFLPSPLVMTASGFFLLEGELSLQFFFFLIFMIAIPYAVGVTVASFLFYGVLYFFGERAVKRWGKWFGLSWGHIEKWKGKMQSTYKDEAMLFFFRVVPIIPSAALASICGFIKMNLVKYTLITFLGVSVRASIFASLGWYLGESYRRYATHIAELESTIGLIFLFLFVSLVIFLLIYTHARSKNVVQ